MNHEKAFLPPSPLFSIAVVSFDQERFIRDCLDSIFLQKYDNIELIICDDHSCDFEHQTIREYIEANKSENIKNVIIFRQQKNVGISLNCQKAFELSHGEYIKFQAADDMLSHENVLSNIASVFAHNQENVIFSRARACTNKGVLLQQIYPYDHNFSRASQMSAGELFVAMSTKTWGAYVCAPAVFFRAQFLKECGGFDASYKNMEDWPLWLKMTRQGKKPYYLNSITMIYRYGGISNRQSRQLWQTGKSHYEECSRMLKKEALPFLQDQAKRKDVLKCRQCINALECKDAIDFDWGYMSIADKIAWRLQNRRFLLQSWISRFENAPFNWKILKKSALLFAVVLICFSLRQQSLAPNILYGICLVLAYGSLFSMVLCLSWNFLIFCIKIRKRIGKW